MEDRKKTVTFSTSSVEKHTTPVSCSLVVEGQRLVKSLSGGRLGVLCRTKARDNTDSQKKERERERAGGKIGRRDEGAAAMGSSSTTSDVKALVASLRSAYVATPVKLKIIDIYVIYALLTAAVQVVYMALVGSFPFNAFLSGVLSCIGTAVLAVCLRMQVNPQNKEFKDLAPARAFADFVLCNCLLHLVIMNFLG